MNSMDRGVVGREGSRAFRVFLWILAVLCAASLPGLWSHPSRGAVVLGRYSLPHAVVLALHGLALGGSLALGLLPRPALAAVETWLRKKGCAFLRRGMALGLALFLTWAAFLSFHVSILHSEMGRSLWLLLVTLAVATWISLGLVWISRDEPRARARALAKLTLALFSAAAGLAGAEWILRSRPDVFPPTLLSRLPGGGQFLQRFYVFEKPVVTGFRLAPRTPMSFRQMASEANLYLQNPGLIRPIEKEKDFVLNQASFVTDELGYRNGPELLETYPIAVSGDSYTSFIVEPRPWPTVLSEKLGLPVLNLGMQGYGPQQEVEALILYGLPRKPSWVILAYFEGNDLRNAQTYELKKSSGLGWAEHDLASCGVLERFLTCHLVRHAAGGLLGLLARRPEARPREHAYPFPFELELGGRKVELTFSPGNLSDHAAPRERIDSLAVWPRVVRSFQRLKAEAEAKGAKLIIAYLPTKEHCYIPVVPPDLLQEKLQWSAHVDVDPEGRFVKGKRPVTAAEVAANAGAQRDAFREKVAAAGIEMLDLTPVFQEAARRGEALFWTNDTHWTPAGSELAASAIAARLEQGS